MTYRRVSLSFRLPGLPQAAQLGVGARPASASNVVGPTTVSPARVRRRYVIEISDDDDSDVTLGAHGDVDDGYESGDSQATLPAIVPSHGSSLDPSHPDFRNDNIGLPFFEHTRYRSSPSPSGSTFTIRVGDTVELGGHLAGYIESDRSGDFFRIRKIIEDMSTEKCFMQGRRFHRTSCSDGTLPYKLNEVYMVLKVDADDSRPALIQGMETLPIQQAFRKRKLILTNDPERYSFRDHSPFDSKDDVNGSRKWSTFCTFELVCRWISTKTYCNAKHRLNQTDKPLWEDMRRVLRGEADIGFGVPDVTLQEHWLGFAPASKTVYTFADVCSGAGGASMAALAAGLEVDWALDHDKRAMETYRMNFPSTDTFRIGVHEFIAMVNRVSGGFHVDVLHISPPCQPYSIANTRPNEDLNEANRATLLAVGDMVKVVKPRLATIEQTFGIMTPQHVVWLRKLIGMFTGNGFSVRWSVFNLNEFGIAMPRRRLIMYATCPGGQLPRFPSPTHSRHDRNLLPLMTIAEALAPLQKADAATITHHRPAARGSLHKPGYSPNTQLSGTITTNGGTAYHPHGRQFTGRELALLLSFPPDYQFPAEINITTIRKQMGNTVPPMPFRPFLEQCIVTLEKENKERAEQQQQQHAHL